MAEPARPLSRRERREMEERAAAAEAAPEPRPVRELDPEPESPSAAPSKPVSRRDRRRMERLEQPMETWTAEEEMRHTGQVPTMTPEVIAQQEELARRRAAEAQEDAVRATGEMHQVSPQQVSRESVRAVTGEDEEYDTIDGEGGPRTPGDVTPVETPGVTRFGTPAEAPEPRAGRTKEDPPSDARSKLAEAAAAAAAALPSERASGMRAFGAPETQSVPQAPHDGAAPPSYEIPSLADLTPPSGYQALPIDAKDQALAQSAEARAARPSVAPGATPPMPPGPQPSGQQQSGPNAGATTPQAAPPNVPGQQGAPPRPQGAPAPPPQPQLQGSPPPQGTPPQGAPPQAKPPTTAVGQIVPGVPGATPSPGAPPGAMPVQGQPPVPQLPAAMTAAGATGAMRAIPGGPTTGSIRAIPGAGPMTGTITRPTVEVQPAGGAREFGWPHIAVLAAVAFTLGIVVWKVSGIGG